MTEEQKKELVASGDYVSESTEIQRLLDKEIENSKSGIPAIYANNILSEMKTLNNEQFLVAKMLQCLMDGKVWCVTIIGSVGNGKTTLATASINEFARKYALKGYRSRYETLRGITDKIRERGENFYEYKSLLKSCELLVIDELNPSLRVWTDAVKSCVEDIIVDRHANKKRTVLIGNLTGEDIRAMFDEQVVSRLREGYSTVMKTADMRKKGDK